MLDLQALRVERADDVREVGLAALQAHRDTVLRAGDELSEPC